MSDKRAKRMQFAFDQLVEQVIAGRKTASVVQVGEVDLAQGEYDEPLVVGDYYDVYDSALVPRCQIRITAMELCRWDRIHERLWRGEANNSPEEFKTDHLTYFDHPNDDFEFVAYYFERISVYE